MRLPRGVYPFDFAQDRRRQMLIVVVKKILVVKNSSFGALGANVII